MCALSRSLQYNFNTLPIVAAWTQTIFFMNCWLGLPDAHRERLKSRRPFVSAAQRLLHDLTELDIRAAQWTDYKWRTEYLMSWSDLCAFIPKTTSSRIEMNFPRSSLLRLNLLLIWDGCLFLKRKNDLHHCMQI